MSETIENTKKLIDFTASKLEQGELNNNTIVQLIELCVDYGNILTIQDYAKKHGMSYNGVKNFRNIILIAGKKFVLDND